MANVSKRLYDAIALLLTCYRTEGCPDPYCGVCAASNAAEQEARAAQAEYEDEIAKEMGSD